MLLHEKILSFAYLKYKKNEIKDVKKIILKTLKI